VLSLLCLFAAADTPKCESSELRVFSRTMASEAV
jgi:hypothetical protein